MIVLTNTARTGCVHVQSYPILCDPMGCSPLACQGASVHGISQVRIQEWIAISFYRGIFLAQGLTCVAYVDNLIFSHWATWKAPLELDICIQKKKKKRNLTISIMFKINLKCITDLNAKYKTIRFLDDKPN